MTKFTTIQEAVEYFVKNGIAHGANEMLEYQDIIGHSTMDQIFDAVHVMNKNERGNFLWVSCHCLSKGTFLDIIKKCVWQSIIVEEETRLATEHAERMQDIERREENMSALERDNAVKTERIKSLELELKYHTERSERLNADARKFNMVRDLLR